MSTNKILLAAAMIAGFAGTACAVEDPAKAGQPAAKTDKVAEKPCPAPVHKHHKEHKPVHHHHHHHHAHPGLTVTLGGDIDTQFGYRKQSYTYDTDQPGLTPLPATVSKLHRFAIVNDTTLNVRAEGQSHWFKYGGKIVLNADTSDNKYGDEEVARETKIWVRNQMGHLEAGSTTGAYAHLRVNAANIARATGGIDGDAQYWWNPYTFNNTSGAPLMGVTPGDFALASETFLLNPNLPSNYSHGLNSNFAKVSYYTPRWMGFKAGVSFAPDSEQRGTVSRTQSVFRNVSLTPDDLNAVTGYKNLWEGGISYKGQFDQVGIRVSLTGNAADAKDYHAGGAGSTVRIVREDLMAWEAGAALSYMGFTLAGSYGDWDDSGVPKTAGGITPLTGKDDASFWNLGLAYEHKGFGASVTYMESKSGPLLERNSIGQIDTITTSNKSNKFRILSVGADYKVAPGFMPYAEVSFFKMKTGVDTLSTLFNTEVPIVGNDTFKNTGYVILVGTKLHF